MGNCQTAEAAMVVMIQHPGGPSYKVESIYGPINAHEVMGSNPGHYVARLAMSSFQLLRPADSLYPGHVYRLIPFEDVVKQYASSSSLLSLSKKRVKLEKLRHEDKARRVDPNSMQSGYYEFGCNMSRSGATRHGNWKPNSMQSGYYEFGCNMSRSGATRHGNWKPALPSIAEIGSR